MFLGDVCRDFFHERAQQLIVNGANRSTHVQWKLPLHYTTLATMDKSTKYKAASSGQIAGMSRERWTASEEGNLEMYMVAQPIADMPTAAYAALAREVLKLDKNA